MQEMGIVISSQKPKPIDEKLLNQMDMVVTLCEENRPTVPLSISTHHWSIPDPLIFQGSEAEIITGFRKVRDMIKKEMLELLKNEG